jgi:hypothetical protein
MSTFMDPTGPQPPSVYWRRRAMVALGLVVVVIVIVLIVVRPGSGAAEPGAAATSTPPAAAEETPEASAPTTGAAPAADATAPATDAPAAGDDATCAAGVVDLVPITDAATYASTQLPQISMSITNTGSVDCSLNLGSSQQALVVTSGQEQWWSSKDCQVNPTDQVVTIQAGQTLTTPAIAWDRTRSTPDTCEGTRTPVPAGGATYRLTVSVGDIVSADTAPMILN